VSREHERIAKPRGTVVPNLGDLAAVDATFTWSEAERWLDRLPDELDDAGLTAIDRDVAAELDEAIALTERGTWEPIAELARGVLAEGSPSSRFLRTVRQRPTDPSQLG
jgi:hypothetical protein